MKILETYDCISYICIIIVLYVFESHAYLHLSEGLLNK